MSDPEVCPVCHNVDGGVCKSIPTGNRTFAFDCSICGQFAAAPGAYNWLMAANQIDGEPTELREITRMQRALVSHMLRNTERHEKLFVIDDEWLEHLFLEGSLPSPLVQAENLVRLIAQQVRGSGEDLGQLPQEVHAMIGAPGFRSAVSLALELEKRGLLKLNPQGGAAKLKDSPRPFSIPTHISLTLDGWQRFEDEQRGKFAGNFGFVAMQFGDPSLDLFVRDVLKPLVKEELGYDLVDMGDVAPAGIIDNIMRTRIRDSAFVIVDLTHDNSGAYWEAGYGEGLGKPVIYICERAKFDADGTHFDTNHSTTVFWSREGPEQFRQKFLATLRRSLDGR